MKGLIISQVLLAVLIVCTVWNAYFVGSVRDELLAYTEALSAEGLTPRSEVILEGACEYWDGVKPLLSLSVGFSELDEVGGCLARLRAALQVGDEGRFRLEIEMLKSALEAVARLERISAESVL